MQCPDCQSQNVPVKESASSFGSYISHPRHCAMCGTALTEKCPICVFHHARGALFCVETGKNIELWRQEEGAWRQLKQSMYAGLAVRPWTMRLVLALSGLAGVLLVLAFNAAATARGEQIDSLLGLTAFSVAIGLFFVIMAALTLSIIKDARCQRLFERQGYQVFKTDIL